MLCNAQHYVDKEIPFDQVVNVIKRGDIIGVEGHPTKSNKGEFSILPLRLVLLSPCLHMLPKAFYGFKDLE